jgi:hypothetical protein
MIESKVCNPILVPTRPWESISMDIVGGMSRTRWGLDYLFVVVDKSSNMCILMACSKTIKGKDG